MLKEIKIYTVYDWCYRGNNGTSSDGFPKGSVIYRTLDKDKAQRIVDAIKPVALRDRQFAPALGEEILKLNNIKVEDMTNEEIINWVCKNKSNK